MMFHYMLMPLDEHYDGGLGAIGEAFEEAADALTEVAEGHRLVNIHLPTSFLYRHAIELFLKSMIIVLHRALALPYGSEPPDGTPMVPTEGRWKAMHKEHRVAILWTHLVEIIHNNESELSTRCQTNWASLPEELNKAIAAVDAADPTSTFFRYTDRRAPEADRAKSSWKEGEPSDILARMGPGDAPVKAFLLVGPEGRIAHSYEYDRHAFEGLSQLLARTAKSLSCAHSGLRAELANGF